MIVYDYEVFKYDWLVVFLDIMKREFKVIVNNPEELKKFHEKNKKQIFIGFNNISYDQYIHKGIMLGMNPHTISDFIINKKKQGWEYSRLFNDIPMVNYDVYNKRHGRLKAIEGHMGVSIVESEVDFNIDRPLTKKEIESTIKYCKADVEQTLRIFALKKNDFQSTLDVINHFNLPLKYIGKSDAQLAGIVLQGVKQPRRDGYDLELPDVIEIEKYKEVVEWYLNPLNHTPKSYTTVNVCGFEHKFAWGGLHSARKNYIAEGDFVLIDVNSYYPSMILAYNLLSRNAQRPELYKDIYDMRFKLKAKGDPKQEAFKLIMNIVYGASGDQYNVLYDPKMRNIVCVTGQLLLLDLLEKFEKYDIMVIQSNTDGILVKYESKEELKLITELAEEWSERTGMKFGYDYFYRIIQKDVNNYIALGKEGTKDVFNGAYVKLNSEMDNDLPILTRSVREYLINGIPPEETINNETRLIEFQKICKVTKHYKYAKHNGVRLRETVLRVFASRSKYDGAVYRYKEGAGYHKFANTSEKSFIDNGDVRNKVVPAKLDRQYYIDRAWKMINDYLKAD